jgi:cytochrome P450
MGSLLIRLIDKSEALVKNWGIFKLILLGTFGLFVVFTLGLYQLLKPGDKRRSPTGKKWKLPPGPRGWPIIGDLFLYAKGEDGVSETLGRFLRLWTSLIAAMQAREIARYGEMTTTHVGSKLWVVLNSNRLATELYARRGAVTNGRPHYPIVSDLISQGKRSVLLPTHEWSERRRVMHQLLSGTAMARYMEYQDEESMTLLNHYIDQPSLWYRHNHHYANSVIHRITFGERPDEKDDKIKDVTKAQFAFLMNAPPLNFWDCFPELSRLPMFLQFWRKRYEEIGQFTHRAYHAYWNPIAEKILAGQAPPSFAKDVVLNEGKFSGSDTDKMFLAMQITEAGSDTTRLAINMFILAAVTHPDKFLKARAELDAICGSNAQRLPNFGDEDSAPYIHACIKEIFRWRRIFIWTPEHELTQDLEFEGYFFPKGTNFVINHTNITTNPDLVESPEKFMPERWLDGNEQDILNGIWQFGAGRRVCVGYRLAQRSLFINLARLIYCFDFKTVSCLDLWQ